MSRTKTRILVWRRRVHCKARRGPRRSATNATHSSSAQNGAECLETLESTPVDLVLLDLRMPVMDGATTLAKLVEAPMPPPVIVITADATLTAAIEAVKAGASNFVAKPYEIGALRHVVERTLEERRLTGENRRLNEEVRRLRGASTLVGESEPIKRTLDAIDRVAPSTASVLITGESGTGKELVARRIHELSAVSKGPFVTINCSAIPDTLVESELFGHRRGAFTGADRDRSGKFQEADRGTLFLDEIGDMALTAQAKLLRVLQEGVVEPLGGGQPVTVDVRVVAATHRDLKKQVADDHFREDLLFRLKVVELPMPPLRERGEDILLLASHFLEELGNPRMRFAADVAARLRSYPWPGNVRELRNAVERASIFCREDTVQLDDLPADVLDAVGSVSDAAVAVVEESDDFQTAKQKVIERFERRALTAALKKHDGNVSHAARALGLHRQNLQQKLRQLDISAKDFR